jgi:plasmid maintenance system antidote protein VapI
MENVPLLAIQHCNWRIFNAAPKFWLGLQTEYDLHLATEQSGQEIMALSKIDADTRQHKMA